jgi:uncharacterized protein YjbJ (UPF0337 family)
MSKLEAEGENDKTRGKIRESVGKLTGDKGEEIHGKLEQAKGEVKEELGKARKKI